MTTTRARLLLAAAAALLIAGCHPAPPGAAVSSGSAPAAASSGAGSAADTTLYARLGGDAGMRAVAAGLASRISADARIRSVFADTDIEAFKLNFAKFLGGLCGGPATYRGPDMKTVHTGLAIADAQFDAMLEDVGATLDERKADAADRAQLLARLGRLRGDIVGH